MIFLIVAFLHCWRFLMRIPVTFGEIPVPLGFSIFGALVYFLLALWMFMTAGKIRGSF